MSRKRIRLITDIAMTVALLLLMAYSLIGELLHEITGTLMLVLFILHHILNRKWYLALFKGKYSARRSFQTGLDMALLLIMVLQPVSGILISKYLYTFLPASRVAASAREVHIFLAYWGFVLMSLHAGIHLLSPIKKLWKQSFHAGIIFTVLCAAVSVYGAVAFIKRRLPDYMLRKTVFAFFDYSEPKVIFFLDYLAIMVLFATAGGLIILGIESLKRKI